METKGDEVPAYPQPTLDAELVLPQTPTRYAAPVVRLAESTTSSFFICPVRCCDAKLESLEADIGMETEGDGVLAYLQPDLEAKLVLPLAPTGHAAPAVQLVESTTRYFLFSVVTQEFLPLHCYNFLQMDIVITE
ncbi:hypothetical protein CsSME_00036548 [Camellia sinensis var. sinensis]